MALVKQELDRMIISGTELVPKTKNIILDLDSTLVWTWEDSQMDKIEKLRETVDFEEISYSLIERDVDGIPRIINRGIKRPYVDTFICFCFLYFKKVCIWSAGTEPYVKRLVEILFRDHPQPHIIYHRDDCELPGYYKPLTKMYDDPLSEGEMNEKNTIILDDNTSTYRFNPDNAIRMPEYSPKATVNDIDKDDSNFFKLMRFFLSEEFIHLKDVRKINKDFLFPVK